MQEWTMIATLDLNKYSSQFGQFYNDKLNHDHILVDFSRDRHSERATSHWHQTQTDDTNTTSLWLLVGGSGWWHMALVVGRWFWLLIGGSGCWQVVLVADMWLWLLTGGSGCWLVVLVADMWFWLLKMVLVADMRFWLLKVVLVADRWFWLLICGSGCWQVVLVVDRWFWLLIGGSGCW